MVNRIVRESQKQFPFVTRSVVNKSYKKHVTGNIVSGLAQIESHPIRNDETKEKPASAGKEPSSYTPLFGEKFTVHPSFIIDQNEIAQGQIKSHPIRNDESKEKPASAGK